MYKVLIIDDERHARQAIKALGNWQEFEITTILEAPDGESGLEIMRERKPDIVLVDIKMPMMGGMDFLKKATSEFSNTKYIIISGYGEFKYAREAIQYKVRDYLLKPVVEEELNKVIKGTVQELNNEKKGAKGNPMDQVIKRLTTQYICGSDNGVHYGIAVLYQINTNDNSLYRVNEIIPAIIKEDWDQASNCFSIGEDPKECLLAITIPKDYIRPSENNIEMSQYAALSIRKIVDILKARYGLYVIAGVGGFTNKIHSLYGSYWDAVNIISSINLLNNNQAVYIQEETASRKKVLSIIDRKELFKRAFEKGNVAYAKDIIEQYFEARKRNGYLSINDLKRNALEYMIILGEIAIENGIEDYKKILPSINKQNELKYFEDPIALTNYVVNLFSDLYNHADKGEILSTEEIVQDIKVYIEDNYFSEISLGMFAAKYYLTKEYLTKQFKEAFGYGIYEYALNIRMEKAAEILLTSGMKIQDISERLGYADSNYFSRAFKNYYGISPGKYRTSKKSSLPS